MRVLFQKLLLFLAALLVLASSEADATFADSIRDSMAQRTLDDALPSNWMEQENSLSSNWMAAVKASLPATYFAHGDPNFDETTNLLCQESRHGNAAAQALWGVVLLVKSQSAEDANAGLQLMRTSASKGYVPAMVQLGLLFEGDKYVHRNYDEAFHWFTLAAGKGDAVAQLQLGGCYHYGLGTVTNLALTAKYYRLSAEQTNYVAMKSLGYLLMNGIGVEKDLDAAKYWFTRAAKEGRNRRAMYNLGVLLRTKPVDTNSLAEAFRWFKQSADLGDALAAVQVAGYYYSDWGVVETNIDSYHTWRLRAAALGSTEAQYRMGVAYRTGDGVPEDTDISLAWYHMAAAKHHPEALYDLAVYYSGDKTNRESAKLATNYMLMAAEAGHLEAQLRYALSCFRADFEPPDLETGKRWLAKAGENGWAPAEFILFQLHYYGIAPATNCPAYPKDTVEGIKWLRRAADHGEQRAESFLGIMLIRGIAMEKDPVTAEKLLRDAAMHGYPAAENDLGYSILNGDVGNGDIVEAGTWCQLAASQSSDPKVLPRAKVNLSNALARLNPEQKMEVKRRAKSFRPLPVVQRDHLQKGWENNPAYDQEDGHFGH